jgi:hypothetical protein
MDCFYSIRQDASYSGGGVWRVRGKSNRFNQKTLRLRTVESFSQWYAETMRIVATARRSSRADVRSLCTIKENKNKVASERVQSILIEIQTNFD